MRTNIEIDDKLLAEAMALSGAKTKRATIEETLRFFVRRKRQARAYDEMHGLGWEGDLDAMRRGEKPRALPTAAGRS